MSLIVGILAKDGIVLASDSKMSNNISSNETVDKIFQLGDNVAVGIAGDGQLAAHLFDIIRLEKKVEFDNDIRIIAEQLRETLSATYDKYFPITKYEKRSELQIILAGYTKEESKKALLYVLSHDDNFIPRQSVAGHDSIGIPYVSQYILNRCYTKDMLRSSKAALLSVYCLKQTMAETQKVGGNITVAKLDKLSFTLLSKTQVSKLSEKCDNMQDNLRGDFYTEDEE